MNAPYLHELDNTHNECVCLHVECKDEETDCVRWSV